jgi:hypothetical protein
MPGFWIKTTWLPTDHVAGTGELAPGAIPPGIYCKDEASFVALKRDARVRTQLQVRGLSGDAGFDLAGMTIRIATPEQAASFQAAESVRAADTCWDPATTPRIDWGRLQRDDAAERLSRLAQRLAAVGRKQA